MIQTSSKDNIYIEIKNIVDLVDEYIDGNINDVNDYRDAINEFNKVVCFMKKNQIKVTSQIAKLLLINKKIYKIIQLVVENNLNAIKNYSYNSLFHGYDLLLIDLYCTKNNIEISEENLADTTIETNNYDSLKMYNETLNLPILSAEKQIKLGKKVAKGRLKDATLKQIKEAKEAKNMLIAHNMRLAYHIAKKYSKYIPDSNLCDLAQEGFFGLNEAANRYNPDKGIKFTTYATWWIRQKIGAYVCSYLELPPHLEGSFLRYSKTLYELTSEYGCEPNVEEIAERLDTKVEKIKRLKDLASLNVSLNKPVEEGKGTELLDYVESYDLKPDINIEQKDLEVYLSRLFKILDKKDPRYSFILIHRYGLFRCRKKTLMEVVEALKKFKIDNPKFSNNISHQRVKQLEKNAFEYLSELIHADYLKCTYYDEKQIHEEPVNNNYFYNDKSTIFTLFPGESEEVILSAISKLEYTDYTLLKERYGTDFYNPLMGQYWNYKKEDYFINKIIPRIKNYILTSRTEFKLLIRGRK